MDKPSFEIKNDQLLIDSYNQVIDAIKIRFPDAKFTVSCFKTVDEIENKVLNDTDKMIIYCDSYEIYYLDKKLRHNNKKYMDYFIVKKRNNKDAIHFCDVIDELIKHKFVRNDCDYRFLESIKLINDLRRNKESVKVYGSFWGS